MIITNRTKLFSQVWNKGLGHNGKDLSPHLSSLVGETHAHKPNDTKLQPAYATKEKLRVSYRVCVGVKGFSGNLCWT